MNIKSHNTTVFILSLVSFSLLGIISTDSVLSQINQSETCASLANNKRSWESTKESLRREYQNYDLQNRSLNERSLKLSNYIINQRDNVLPPINRELALIERRMAEIGPAMDDRPPIETGTVLFDNMGTVANVNAALKPLIERQNYLIQLKNSINNNMQRANSMIIENNNRINNNRNMMGKLNLYYGSVVVPNLKNIENNCSRFGCSCGTRQQSQPTSNLFRGGISSS